MTVTSGELDADLADGSGFETANSAYMQYWAARAAEPDRETAAWIPAVLP